jgi:FkbM family methyltransferase
MKRHALSKIAQVLNRGFLSRNKRTYKKSMRSDLLSFHKTSTGSYYLPKEAYGDVVANTIKRNKIFEEEVVLLAKKYIKPNSIVLDVGSNFGQMAILFSEAVGEKGKVYAFEADDFIFEILKKNIEANNLLKRIIPVFGAVHKSSGERLFFPIQDFKRFSTYGSYGIDYNGREGREVISLTIDDLNIQEKVSFMKVDIQGGDLYAMEGAIRTIHRNRMPILFEYEYQFEDEFNYNFQQYVDFVGSINYEFHKVINGHNYLILPK